MLKVNEGEKQNKQTKRKTQELQTQFVKFGQNETVQVWLNFDQQPGNNTNSIKKNMTTW